VTTTLKADGTFQFDDIDPSARVQYEPMAVYNNIAYFGDLDTAIVLSAERPEADVNITIYETTEDPSDIRIERLHIVLDFVPGQVQVAELYILSNDGEQAYGGTLEGGTLPLTEPPNAISFQPGGDPGRYLSLADGIADTMPIPPGQGTMESVIVYELAYDGELELSRPLPFDVSKVNVFLPAQAGIEVSGDGIRSGEPFQSQGALMDTFLADDLAAGEKLVLRLSGDAKTSLGTGASSPHQPSGPDEMASIVIGLTALAGAVAVAVLYWQGRLKLNFRLPAQDRQTALLRTMADLDDDYVAGRVDEETYLARRAKLKGELIELMQAEDRATH
jgi:hypothetical protein